MNSNLLAERILQIQYEYKALLSNLIISLEGNISYAAMDEINLFWIRNMDIVRLYLSAEFAKKDNYVFTASTFLDFNENEQYPFLLIGSQHILDDPLCKYSGICSKMPEGKIAETLFEQISKTAEDNLNILTNCQGQILVLPFRLLSQTPTESLVFQVGEQAFVSLFDNINNLKDYFEKCDSFDDIMKYARKDIENLVLFCESDDKTLSFEQRFRMAKEENSYMMESGQSEAYNFFVMVFGGIQQAVDVIISCMEYECTPFIRYPVALHYILLLAETLSDISFISEMRYKMCVANILYRICEKERLSKFGFEKFIAATISLDFNHMLFKALSEHDVCENNFTVNDVVPVVEKCLNQLYVAIESV